MSLNLKYAATPCRRVTFACTGLLVTTLVATPAALAQDPRVPILEKRVDELSSQLEAVLEEVSDLRGAGDSSNGNSERFALGGYGESHANFVQGSDNDVIDNHRFVLFLGYEFADWIHLHSETEIEHSFVNDGNGELSIEQLHTDFTLVDAINVRVGRFLVPVGITNETHEPTTFYSVERPSVDRVLIPTTWSSDGAGIFGHLGEHVEYQVYIGSGLDGSKFTSSGIRGGRIAERPTLNNPAFTGRIDVRPLPSDSRHDLRIGLSGFASGLDNGNKRVSGAPGTVYVAAADAQYRAGILEFRGTYVFEYVDGARALNAAFGNDVATQMSGYYIEAAAHLLPEDWKTGKLQDADAVAFARFEHFDTQDKLASGATRVAGREASEATTGLAFFLTSQFVLKADYTFRDGLDDLWNLGVGWQF